MAQAVVHLHPAENKCLKIAIDELYGDQLDVDTDMGLVTVQVLNKTQPGASIKPGNMCKFKYHIFRITGEYVGAVDENTIQKNQNEM